MNKSFWRKTFWILLTPILVLSVFGAVSRWWILPRISDWAREQAQTLVNTKTPLRLTLDDLEIELIPIQVTARLVKLEDPQGSIPALGSLDVAEARLRLDFFELLFGRTEVATIEVQGLNGALNLDPLMESDAPPSELPIADLFKALEKIPLRRITISNSSVALASKKLAAGGTVRANQLEIEARRQRISLRGDADLVDLAYRDMPKLAAQLKLEADVLPKELVLRKVLLARNEITLEANGRIDDLAQLPLKPHLALAVRANLPLEILGREFAEIPALKQIPDLQGHVTASGEVKLEGRFSPQGRLEVKTQAVRVGPIDIGDAVLASRLSDKAVEVESIDLRHPAGQAKVTKTKISFEAPFQFNSKIDVARLQLQPLFRALDLNEIPVDVGVKGAFQCGGELHPLQVRCSGAATGDKLVVKAKNEPKAFTIVDIEDMEASGDVSLNLEEVRFESKLRIGKSQGETRGRVGFQTGFRIDFRAPQVHFSDVKNLASLSFSGTSSIEGWTEGDTDAAIFDIKLGAKDFVFENFTLGAVDGLLRYRAGKMHFEDLRQSLGRTSTRGNFVLDLNRDTIEGQMQSDALDAADLPVVFSKLWQFPLDIQANGSARMSFSGPLDLWSMTYRLEAEFKNGRLQGDAFDRLDLVAEADKGRMRLETAEMKKNQTLVRARGGISPQKDLDILVDVIGLRLEESEFVNRIRSQVAGQLNMTAQLQGKIDDPDIRLRGSLSDIYVDEQDIPSSFFRARLNRQSLEGETNLFGNKIQGDLLLPLGGHAGPLRMRVKTTDWPFTGLLSLIGASGLQNEYESNLTSEIDLSSNSGRFDQVSGRILIREFSLNRGGLNLRNPRSSQILLDNGRITLRDMLLEGPGNAVIRLQGEGFKLDALDVGVQAKTDLRLLHMFAPFLEDLGGPFQVSANLTGSIFKPQLLGNASLKDAYVKIKGFPHPLEKLKTDIVFSHSRVLIQNLTAQLAGGSVRGDGSVQINGIGDIPVNIRARAEGLNMNVPDKVRTAGNADLQFTGSWFPFILSGTYRVHSGLVEMEFGGGDGTGNAPRTSVYLPKILRQANFDPVILDLQVILDRPIQVRNSQMDGGASGQLQVKGPPQNPILIGRINTERGSRIIVKDKTFDLTTGVINFTDPTEVNPELYLSAQSRVEEYDVNVLIQGSAKAPSIRMSSVPPLSEQDIISLLALGITSQQLEGSVQSREQAAQLGYEALGLGLSRTGISKGLESTTGFNLQITSSFDNTRNISVPKLQLNRRVSDRLNAVYARPLTGDQNAQEVKMQYRINSNVSAVGSYEERASQEGVGLVESAVGKESIFGLDLEFKREFR